MSKANLPRAFQPSSIGATGGRLGFHRWLSRGAAFAETLHRFVEKNALPAKSFFRFFPRPLRRILDGVAEAKTSGGPSAGSVVSLTQNQLHMTCVTFDDAVSVLAQQSVRLDGARNLLFPENFKTLMTNMPRDPWKAAKLVEDLVEWLPPGCCNLLWLSHWQTEPPHQQLLIEQMRAASGDRRHLIDAPALLFGGEVPQDMDMLKGICFLLMQFNWEGYVVSQEHGDFAFLGDEHIVFGSSVGARLTAANGLAAVHGLRLINDVREAW